VNFSKGARFKASPKDFFRQDSAKYGKELPAFGKALPNICRIGSKSKAYGNNLPNDVRKPKTLAARFCRTLPEIGKSLPQLPNGLITGSRDFYV